MGGVLDWAIMGSERFASVALEIAVNQTLDYAIPEPFAGQAKRGMKVSVPVRGQIKPGYIVEIKEAPSFPRVQPIAKLHTEVVVERDLLTLALWMSRYYGAPLRKVFKVILPSPVRNEKKDKQQQYVLRAKTKSELRELCIAIRSKSPKQADIIEAMLSASKGMLLTELLEKTGGTRAQVKSLVDKGAFTLDVVRIDRSPLAGEEYFLTKPKTLSDEQKAAFEKVTASLGQFDVHLIHGITGSGKTEIYIQAIDRVLSMGKGAVMMVPEISLTAQMIERFRSRFDKGVAILHYRLSQGERLDEWKRVQRGEAKIVVGPRSAVFSPVQDLGLIIVDEEHEGTYKQSEESPYYQARDVAVMRGKIVGCPVILGSATPSLESMRNAKRGKYILSVLKSRADSASLPKVQIVDMLREYEKAKGPTIFSDALLSGIQKRYEKGEQSLLFLNRRGYHTSMICPGCQESLKCPHCDVAMTYHRGKQMLKCHLCSKDADVPKYCAKCGEKELLKFRGVGTEQVERALHAIFPEIRTIRLDADTTRHKGSHQKLLREFGSGKADVLIGTQMVAKGLHFPGLTLVGVLNSDGALNIPDFRASENVFQLITQVAGRSGRGVSKGEVIIQTTMPDNPTIQQAAQQDYDRFYEEEIQVRELFDYPPFTHIAKIQVAGPNEQNVFETACHIRSDVIAHLSQEIEILPVVPSGYKKIKDRYRFQFIVKGKNLKQLTSFFHDYSQKTCNRTRVNLDIDTSSTFF